MKSIVKEIRQQPEPIKHIFMWTLVVITFSIVGFVWFRSTQKKFIALLNPEAAQESAVFAQSTKAKIFSPLATIINSWKDLTANISELFAGRQLDLNLKDNNPPNNPEIPPQKLPLSN